MNKNQLIQLAEAYDRAAVSALKVAQGFERLSRKNAAYGHRWEKELRSVDFFSDQAKEYRRLAKLA